ncbi:MAG TPA: glycoside hydrolase family 3 C-terminal domain-containing protein [Anaerolineae bacterium]|nr:glycoside hydrolase family 3 C-terminal domain-containing protein [Anaerolineae bacterium]
MAKQAAQLTLGMTKQEIAAFVEQVLPGLTLDEKISLMAGRRSNMLRLLWSTLAFRQITRHPVPAGGIARHAIPPVLFSDGPRGAVVGNSTCFPVAMARGATWDPELEERIGEAMAREIRALGGNYFGGVCINLLRHPGWGRAQETYGEDTYLLGEMGAALVRGVQKHNVMACVKHFALNSIERSRYRVDVRASERTLREIYLAHFKRCIDEGAASVMGAYNRFRGEHCCQSSYLLTDILRSEWGFDGFVTSDWMNGIRDTVKAAESGMDIEMPSPKFYGKRLKKAVEQGQIQAETIDRAASNILRKVAEFASAPDPQSYDKSLVACEAHADLALEAAEKSIVLLRNQGPILPLAKREIRTLAVLGRLAAVENTGDHGSSRVVPPYTIPPLQGLQDYLADTGAVLYADGTDLAQAQRAASSADAVVIVAGYDYRDEGEYVGDWWPNGNDRDSLSLHDADVRLIKSVAEVNERCIVLLVGGSAIIMEEWRQSVPAILMTFYSGQEGGRAIAHILFGEANPGGKLPFTIPESPRDLPFFDPDADEIEYGFYHGYALMDKYGIEPAFPFGFGLSYTTFIHDNLSLSETTMGPDGELTVSLDVTNTGEVAGAEVVQLYVGYEGSQVERHVKDLKGFRRVFLQPGETGRVHIPLQAEQLAYYDSERSTWTVEPITYKVLVGSSSAATDLQGAEFQVIGR